MQSVLAATAHMAFLVFELAPDGTTLFVNDAARGILGYWPDDLRGRNWWATLCPGDQTSQVARLEAGGDVTALELRVTAKDGSLVILQLNTANRYRDDGGLDRFVGFALDVTARGRAEEIRGGLDEIGRELVGELDFPQAARRIVAIVLRLFQVRRAVLYEADPDTGALTAAAVSEGGPDRWSGRTLQPGEGLSGRAVQEGRPIVSADLFDDPRFTAPPWGLATAGADGLASGVAVPLSVRGRVIGALTLFDGPGRAFGDDELHLLTTFAGHAALALDGARLFRETERQRRAAETLAELGRVMSQSLDPAVVAERIVENVRTLVGARTVALCRLEPESGDFVVLARSGEVTALDRIPRGIGLVVVAVRDRCAAVSADVLTDPRVVFPPEMRAELEKRGLRACVVVPLFVGGAVSGVLILADQVGRVFRTADIELLQTFANRAALSLENARLYDEAQRRLARTETLLAVSQTAGSVLDPVEAGKHIAREMATALGADMAAVYLPTPDGRGLTALACHCEPETLCREILGATIPLAGHTFVEEAWASGRVAWTDDAATDPRLDRALLQRFPHRSVLFVPMRAGETSIGGLVAVWWHVARRPSDEDLRLVDGIGRQAATIVANARLYRESETRRREAESLAAVSRLLLETLDREVMARHITDNVRALLGTQGAIVREVDARGALVAVGQSGTGLVDRPGRGPGVGIAGLVVQEGRPVTTSDWAADPRSSRLPYVTDALAATTSRAFLGVPLRTQTGIIGALVVGDRAGRVFTGDEIRLTEVFADAAALALQNTRLYAASERRRREAEVLAEVERSFSASMDLEHVLARVAEGARDLCGADAARVALRGADGTSMTFQHFAGPPPEGWRDLQVMPRTGAGDLVLRTGRAFRTDNYAEDSRLGPEWRVFGLRNGTVAEIVVPIPGHEQIEGLLYVINRSPRLFTDQDEAVLTRLAAHAAVAIRNSRLLAREQEARAAAEMSAGTLRLLFESSPLPMLVFDGDTFEILEANETAVVHLGYARADLLGRRTLDLMVPEERDQVLALQAHVARHQPQGMLRTGPWKYRRKDGTIIDAEIASHALEFHGRAARLAVVIDVTEKLRAEEEARRLAAIVQSANDAIMSTDLEGAVQSWNAGAERMLGFTAAEVIGRPVSALAPPERSEEFRRILERLGRGDPAHSFETVQLTKAGHPLQVSVTVSPIRDAMGRVVRASVIASDISERRKLEAQLRQAQKMEAVGRLAGGVAHDFNNLLTVISGRGQFVLLRLGAKDPSRRDVELILKSTERAARLTHQLLAFSRKQILEPKIMDLDAAIGGIESMLRRLIGEDVDLKVSGHGDLGRVKADPGQIEQVILNLAINARDAMPRGGRLTIETANVELDAAYAAQHADVAVGRYAMLAVGDTGIGMDAATQAHLFEPFFTTKEVGKGTGLGLSTVYGIVKQSQGHITVDSEVGHGSVFRVYLPCVEGAIDASHAVAKHSPPPRGTETVLMVEDEADLRELAVEALTSWGYTVLEATSPAAALRLSEGHHGQIQLVVTDVIMPGLSGRELADRLLAARPGLKVLFISGYADTAIVHLVPGTAFLQKPFPPDTLARKVREVLDA